MMSLLPPKLWPTIEDVTLVLFMIYFKLNCAHRWSADHVTITAIPLTLTCAFPFRFQ